MAVGAKLRKGISRFLILSAGLHLLISACVFIVEHRQKAQVAKVDLEQKPITFYPAMLLDAGGTRAKRTDALDGRKKRPQETKQATDLAINRNRIGKFLPVPDRQPVHEHRHVRPQRPRILQHISAQARPLPEIILQNFRHCPAPRRRALRRNVPLQVRRDMDRGHAANLRNRARICESSLLSLQL